MIRYLGCEHARTMLPLLVDGELNMEDQVALESHLRWCRTCELHVSDLNVIGDSLRLVAAEGHQGRPCNQDDERLFEGLQSAVLTRVKAEHDDAFPTRVRILFEDMHMLWAGVGATAAAIVGLILAITVLQASQNLKAESLAAVIDVLSKPGSDQNPLRLTEMMRPPRLFMPEITDGARTLVPEDDAFFALATVVTREGRISASALLSSQTGDGNRALRPSRDDRSMLRFAVEQRFAPAVSVEGPVAVNMVWLIARTTVKGSSTAFDDLTRPNAPRPRRAS